MTRNRQLEERKTDVSVHEILSFKFEGKKNVFVRNGHKAGKGAYGIRDDCGSGVMEPWSLKE